MATLELRKSSKWWYGRWTENGRVIVHNLDVKVEGTRPCKGSESGDRLFLRSRSAAEDKLRQIARESHTRKHVEGLAQAVHVARTGHRVGTILLADVFSAWQDIPRKQVQLSAVYLSSIQGVFRRFVEFFTTRYPSVKDLSGITYEMASAFLASERARNISGRSFNFGLSLLRSTFRHLRRQAGIVDNPFDEIVSQDEATVHRIPFTPAELRTILEVVKQDDFCRPLFVTGICTAMRRGDVCQLRWTEVDMDNRFITVNTSKTGVKVSIPMFNMLWDELNKLPRTGEFCFPEQALMYQTNQSGIALRLARVFEAAGFVDPDVADVGKAEGDRSKKGKKPPVEVLDDAEMLLRGRPCILGCKEYTSKVCDNMLRIFERYMSGATLTDLMQEFNLSKAGAGTYLGRIEKVVQFPVVRKRRPKAVVKSVGASHVRRHGLKKVNQRGFHAFRASWVTIALTAGVPVDLVRKVTGHTTVEMVLTNYFQPGREDFRKTIMSAMPDLLTAPGKAESEKVGGGQADPAGAGDVLEEALKALEAMNAKNWRKQRDVAAVLIRKANGG
jgi:integrase